MTEKDDQKGSSRRINNFDIIWTGILLAIITIILTIKITPIIEPWLTSEKPKHLQDDKKKIVSTDTTSKPPVQNPRLITLTILAKENDEVIVDGVKINTTGSHVMNVIAGISHYIKIGQCPEHKIKPLQDTVISRCVEATDRIIAEERQQPAPKSAIPLDKPKLSYQEEVEMAQPKTELLPGIDLQLNSIYGNSANREVTITFTIINRDSPTITFGLKKVDGYALNSDGSRKYNLIGVSVAGIPARGKYTPVTSNLILGGRLQCTATFENIQPAVQRLSLTVIPVVIYPAIRGKTIELGDIPISW